MSKQAWILIGAILGTSVFVHAVAITWAVGAQVDLVRDDYYEHGQAFDVELAAREQAARVGFSAHLKDGELTVVPVRPELVQAPVVAQLYRPNNRNADREIEMTWRDGAWRASPTVSVGMWRLRVKTGGEQPAAWLAELHVTAPAAAGGLR
jgi:hypothetical protein